ncbi:MAG: hypothetical protein RBT63_07015 [Bdellovibrionales bacterium]|nr:hypothetical protein [Bdellovibrionales bacterium]
MNSGYGSGGKASQQEIRKQMTVPLVIWGTMVASILVQLFVAKFAGSTEPALGARPESLNDSGAADAFFQYGAIATCALGLYVGHVKRFWTNYQQALKAHIIALALCQACGLFGLVMIMTHSADGVKISPMVLFAVAILSLLTLFPTARKFKLVQ